MNMKFFGVMAAVLLVSQGVVADQRSISAADARGEFDKISAKDGKPTFDTELTKLCKSINSAYTSGNIGESAIACHKDFTPSDSPIKPVCDTTELFAAKIGKSKKVTDFIMLVCKSVVSNPKPTSYIDAGTFRCDY